MTSTWHLELSSSRNIDHAQDAATASQLFGLESASKIYPQQPESNSNARLYSQPDSTDNRELELMFGSLGLDEPGAPGSLFPTPQVSAAQNQLDSHGPRGMDVLAESRGFGVPRQQPIRPIGSETYNSATEASLGGYVDSTLPQQTRLNTLPGFNLRQDDKQPMSTGCYDQALLVNGSGSIEARGHWSSQLHHLQSEIGNHLTSPPRLRAKDPQQLAPRTSKAPQTFQVSQQVPPEHQNYGVNTNDLHSATLDSSTPLIPHTHVPDDGFNGYITMPASSGHGDNNHVGSTQFVSGNGSNGSHGFRLDQGAWDDSNLSGRHDNCKDRQSFSPHNYGPGSDAEYSVPQEELKTSISPVMQPVQVQIIPSGQTVYVTAASNQGQFHYAPLHYQPPVHVQPQSQSRMHPRKLQVGRDNGAAVNGHSRFMSPLQLHDNYSSFTEYIPPRRHLKTQAPTDYVGPDTTVPQSYIVALDPASADVYDAHNRKHDQQQYGYTGRSFRARDRGPGRPRRAGGYSVRRQNSADTRYYGNSLLDEFKANKSREWTVLDIQGNIPEFCQDQNGSRFIQQRLEIGDPQEKEYVLREVLQAIERLRNDVFGNYVVQKLFDFGTVQMKSDLCATLNGDMVHLSLQMYGCRVVQKALEVVDERTLPNLLDEFKNHVLDCIYDQNGNHVIQKCIEVVHKRSRHAMAAGDYDKSKRLDAEIGFIIDDVLANVTSLSCHPYGCRVLQRILEHCEGERKKRSLVAIRDVHRTLLDDQYGNYVIQHVLHYGTDLDRDSVLAIVIENGLLKLSRQKFASNVVEKLLKHGSQKHRKAIVREMLKKAGSSVTPKDSKIIRNNSGQDAKDSSVVLFMVRDAFANYVVQTALDVLCECDEKKRLLQELNSHSTELRNYTFAKHIVTKLAG